MKKEIYSVKVTFKGKKRILSLVVGDEINLILSDLDGNILEHIKQDSNNLQFFQSKK